VWVTIQFKQEGRNGACVNQSVQRKRAWLNLKKGILKMQCKMLQSYQKQRRKNDLDDTRMWAPRNVLGTKWGLRKKMAWMNLEKGESF
jgi:hypothetical protein